MTGVSPNHAFLLDAAARFSGVASPRILDFGCGLGEAVAHGRSLGFDMVGADAFESGFEVWRDRIAPEAQDHVVRIADGLPFPDATFDAVVSNQVFEHIADPRPPLAEIARVLKPGGVAIALFPARETHYEGHVKLWFAHRLTARPALLAAYLSLGRALGRGALSEAGASGQSPRAQADWLAQNCFYHRAATFETWLRRAFGAAPTRLEAEAMGWRLRGSRIEPWVRRAAATSAGRSALAAIYRARAGVAFAIRKPA